MALDIIEAVNLFSTMFTLTVWASGMIVVAYFMKIVRTVTKQSQRKAAWSHRK